MRKKLLGNKIVMVLIGVGSAPTRRSVLVFSLRAAVVAVLITPLAVAQPSGGQRTSKEAQAQRPTFRTEVNYIEVDVTVTDSQGNFVRGLGPKDFEVREDGKRQEVAAFGVVDLPVEVRSPLSPLSSTRFEPDIRSNDGESEGRVFVIVLDDLHTHPLRSARVKEVARRFVEGYIGPRDLVSVVHTSGRADASQEFTQRRSLLLASVDKFMGRKLRSRILEQVDAQVRQQDTRTSADIRMQRVFDPLDAERGREAENMLATLQRIGEALAATRGRRNAAMLISEGLDYDLELGVAQTTTGLSTFTSSYAPSVLSRLRQALSAMTRSSTAVYSIDPRGLATAGDDAIEVGQHPENPFLGLGPTAFQDELRRAQDSLRVLSQETGGVASVGSNDFSDALERIVRDNSTYYLLGYYSGNTRRDGRFRKIEVHTKRPGVAVRARKGYLAASSREPAEDRTVATAGPEPSDVLRPLLHHPLPVGGVPLRAFAAAFKGPGANGMIMFGLEVEARNFKFGQEDGLRTNKLDAVVVPLDREGKFLEGDSYSIQLRLKPETYEVVHAHGVRLLFRLVLPPGRYQLRAAAHETESGGMGSIHYDIHVPDFGKEPLSMSGLVLTSTSAAATPTPRPDPELAALLREQPPTGSREFTPAEMLAVAFALYQDPRKSLGTVGVATTVAGADGQVRFNSAIEVSSDELRQAPNGSGYMVQVPLADMAPGTYALRVQAQSRLSEDVMVVRELPFQVRRAEPTRR